MTVWKLNGLRSPFADVLDSSSWLMLVAEYGGYGEVALVGLKVLRREAGDAGTMEANCSVVAPSVKGESPSILYTETLDCEDWWV